MTNIQKPPADAKQTQAKPTPPGIVAVEVRVREEHAGLMRDIAEALGDPARETATRDFLRAQTKPSKSGDLKALLEAAPLEGIPLDRPREVAL